MRRDRQPVRPRPHRHRRHRLGRRPPDPGAERLPDQRRDPDRRRDQPRQLGRPAARTCRARSIGINSQIADSRRRRQRRRRLRDPDRHGQARSPATSRRTATSRTPGSASRSPRRPDARPTGQLAASKGAMVADRRRRAARPRRPACRPPPTRPSRRRDLRHRRRHHHRHRRQARHVDHRSRSPRSRGTAPATCEAHRGRYGGTDHPDRHARHAAGAGVEPEPAAAVAAGRRRLPFRTPCPRGRCSAASSPSARQRRRRPAPLLRGAGPRRAARWRAPYGFSASQSIRDSHEPSVLCTCATTRPARSVAAVGRAGHQLDVVAGLERHDRPERDPVARQLQRRDRDPGAAREHGGLDGAGGDAHAAAGRGDLRLRDALGGAGRPQHDRVERQLARLRHRAGSCQTPVGSRHSSSTGRSGVIRTSGAATTRWPGLDVVEPGGVARAVREQRDAAS